MTLTVGRLPLPSHAALVRDIPSHFAAGCCLQRELVGVLAARKLHPETLDAHRDQFFRVFLRCSLSGLVAVVGDVDSFGAVLAESLPVLVVETVHAVAGGHVAIARAPERQRVDQRFAQDDVFGSDQRLLVPHPALWSRQVQVVFRAGLAACR